METMEEMDLLIKSELEKCGIPTDNLDGAVNTLADFCEAHNDMRNANHSVFYVVLLAVAYKAGRESATVPPSHLDMSETHRTKRNGW